MKKIITIRTARKIIIHKGGLAGKNIVCQKRKTLPAASDTDGSIDFLPNKKNNKDR
jgi:hypothetical protein